MRDAQRFFVRLRGAIASSATAPVSLECVARLGNKRTFTVGASGCSTAGHLRGSADVRRTTAYEQSELACARWVNVQAVKERTREKEVLCRARGRVELYIGWIRILGETGAQRRTLTNEKTTAHIDVNPTARTSTDLMFYTYSTTYKLPFNMGVEVPFSTLTTLSRLSLKSEIPQCSWSKVRIPVIFTRGNATALWRHSLDRWIWLWLPKILSKLLKFAACYKWKIEECKKLACVMYFLRTSPQKGQRRQKRKARAEIERSV